MRPTIYLSSALLTMCALVACSDDDYNDTPTAPPLPALPTAQVVTSSGDLTSIVAQFRALLGEPRNGGTVGPAAAGRREIGWDGVPAEFNNGDNRFPAAFFNTTTKLGLVMTTPGTGFRNDSSLFGDLDAGFKTQFAAFSPNKLFSVNGSNIIDVEFQLPGQPSRALVAGFGAVFVDVDVAGPTTLEFFDKEGRSLSKVSVPVRLGGTPFSFAGARFADPVVARVRIVLGTGEIGVGVRDVTAGGASDIVVLDDFLYTEPQPLR